MGTHLTGRLSLGILHCPCGHKSIWAFSTGWMEQAGVRVAVDGSPSCIGVAQELRDHERLDNFRHVWSVNQSNSLAHRTVKGRKALLNLAPTLLRFSTRGPPPCHSPASWLLSRSSRVKAVSLPSSFGMAPRGGRTCKPRNIDEIQRERQAV